MSIGVGSGGEASAVGVIVVAAFEAPALMADWLVSDGIAQRTRDRILGHASDVRGRYGRKVIIRKSLRRSRLSNRQ